MAMAEARYDFELDKVVKFVAGVYRVVLQFPEGLMRYATTVAAYVRAHADCTPIILGDVTYGACNFDEFIAAQLRAAKYIHFGHSYVVEPFSGVECLFIPCRLRLRIDYYPAYIAAHITENGFRRVQLVATAQTYELAAQIVGYLQTAVPGVVAPLFKHGALHAGELLGCTCYRFAGVDAVYSLADGLFHAEAVRVTNPGVMVFRVDLTHGAIEPVPDAALLDERRRARMALVRDAAHFTHTTARFNLVFGTLGRQSSIRSLTALERFLRTHLPTATYLIQPLQEILPAHLLPADLVVQLSCPRLTFDWGAEFPSNVIGLWEFYQIFSGTSEYKLVNFGGDLEEAGAFMDTCTGSGC